MLVGIDFTLSSEKVFWSPSSNMKNVIPDNVTPVITSKLRTPRPKISS